MQASIREPELTVQLAAVEGLAMLRVPQLASIRKELIDEFVKTVRVHESTDVQRAALPAIVKVFLCLSYADIRTGGGWKFHFASYSNRTLNLLCTGV